MNGDPRTTTDRLLIVDDNRAIHADFRKILVPAEDTSSVDALAEELLGVARPQRVAAPVSYRLDSAYQGEEALDLLLEALDEDDPYALAFVDMRMPPGWDGLETIRALWRADPALQIVICTAYSEHSWSEVVTELGASDNLLILKKPFENVEVLQLALALTRKWHSAQQARTLIADLDGQVARRTESLHRALRRLERESVARERVAAELRVAHRLEAVGRLAAGVAHEINTPIQFVADSVHFSRDAVATLLELDTLRTRAIAGLGADEDVAELLQDLVERERSEDVQFLRVELAPALERALEGIARVTEIIRAMKEFAHPDSADQEPADLAHLVETTLIVARNEYKYVAEVETRFAPLPPVTCQPGAINQVLLNLVVNAAHAIAAAGREPGVGRITISGDVDGDFAVLRVADNGCGIAPEHIEHIYDPFFTTKEVGRGSGQGLAITRAIVVDRHGGAIDVETSPGQGTCFTLRLPFAGTAPA